MSPEEKILDKNAKKFMVEWDIEEFKKTHPRLFRAIMASMSENSQRYRKLHNQKTLLRT